MAHLRLYKNASHGMQDGEELVIGTALIDIITGDPGRNNQNETDGPYAADVPTGYGIYKLGLRCDAGWVASSISIGIRKISTGVFISSLRDHPVFFAHTNANTTANLPFWNNPNYYDVGTTMGVLMCSYGISTTYNIRDTNIIIMLGAAGKFSEKGQNIQDYELVISYVENPVV